MSASAWQTVLDRLDDAAKLADIDPDIHRMLRTRKRVLEVAVPVRMDDGSIEVFTGWRVHHDTTRGPGKGGIRFHRSEEHTSELQSLMRISYAVFCLKKQTIITDTLSLNSMTQTKLHY